jgi:hypothetical protein
VPVGQAWDNDGDTGLGRDGRELNVGPWMRELSGTWKRRVEEGGIVAIYGRE